MLSLALITLRARKSGFIGTFIALLMGSALLSVCGILVESGNRSAPPAERYAAADVVVSGRQQAEFKLKEAGDKTPDPGGEKHHKTRRQQEPLTERVHIPARLAGRIAEVPGVAAVVPDLSFPARVVHGSAGPLSGPRGYASLGHNWSSSRLGPFVLTAGRAPRGTSEVVLDTELAVRAGVKAGGTVSLMTGSAPKRYHVSGIATLKAEPGLVRQSAVFFSDRTAIAFAGHRGTVDALGVLAEPDTGAAELGGRISDALDDTGLSVSTGDRRGKVEFLDVARTGFTLTSLANGISSNVFIVAIFVVASTLALSIQHRKREIAMLRAIGATPGQVRMMITAESAAIAVAGGVLGWPIGVALVYWTRNQFAGHGLVPPDFEPTIGPFPLLSTVGVSLLTALLATLSASRRATKIRPTAALGEAAVERAKLGLVRLITGILLVVGSLLYFFTALKQRGDFATLFGVANILLLTLVIAVGVLGPAIAHVSMRIVGPIMRISRVGGYLAAANSRANAARMAGAITPLVLAVSFASTVVFAQTTSLDASADQTRAGTLADHVLLSPAGLSPQVAEEVRRLPEVKAATGTVQSKAVAVGRKMGAETTASVGVQGVSPRGLRDTLDLDVREGSLDEVTGDNVAISTAASSWLGLDLGDTARLTMGDGTRIDAKVVAVYGRGFGFADITFAHDELLRHTTDRLDKSVLVRTREGADPERTAAALAGLAKRYPGTVVQDQLAINDELEAMKSDAWVNYVLVGMIIAYIAISMVNTLVMNTAARGREFALLRLVGGTPQQVRRMMWWESGAVVATGAVLGTAASLPPLILVAYAMNGTAVPSVPPLTYLLITGVTGALASAASLIPTWLSMRTAPVDSIGTKE